MVALSIELVTKIDRHKLIEDVRNAIFVLDGWIEDFRFFSNISAMISAVLPSRNANRFAAMLADIGLILPAETIESLAREATTCIVDSEFLCALNVNFIHGDGDLRIPTPAVPG